MSDMHDAFTLARALDGRLAHLDGVVVVDCVAEFHTALYDYRADGDLDAFLARCNDLLAALPSVDDVDAHAPPTNGPCHRALDAHFSSG